MASIELALALARGRHGGLDPRRGLRAEVREDHPDLGLHGEATLDAVDHAVIEQELGSRF